MLPLTLLRREAWDVQIGLTSIAGVAAVRSKSGFGAREAPCRRRQRSRPQFFHTALLCCLIGLWMSYKASIATFKLLKRPFLPPHAARGTVPALSQLFLPLHAV